MDNLDNKNVPKCSAKFYCDLCCYSSSRKSQYVRHLTSQKHLDNLDNNTDNKKVRHHICICGKKYNYVSGLSKHRNKCSIYNKNRQYDHYCYDISSDNIAHVTETKLLSNLVLEVVKNNSDLQKQCMELQKQNHEFQQKVMDSFQEVCKNGINNTNNINTNSHNKTFNLNFFLNETCKNAMNISDFVNSIQLQLSDLENVGQLGFINGISDIIVKNLKVLDVTQRPIHCTDAKREIMYIKDEDKWEKENEENIKIRKVIKHIAYKNTKLLSEFKSKYPDCGRSESKYADKYNKLIIEAMGGRGDDDTEKENKIIKKIVKEIIIEK